MTNVTEFPGSSIPSLSTVADKSALEVLEREAQAYLDGCRETKAGLQNAGREPSQSTGEYERALRIERLFEVTRQHISQGNAVGAVESAIEGAYLLSELAALDWSDEDRNAIRENIRLACQPEG